MRHRSPLPNKGAFFKRHYAVSEVLTNGFFQYEVDWDSGDLVTVQNKAWNLTMDTRITEVEETYETGGFKLNVTFGHTLPSKTIGNY
ncbi:Gp37-like protein [Desulfoscipio gibsoniae]|uniref:Gp37-like protein n=1 Tax=Desulfoscipio gibsoniae TaxID=102134 RepID=UPI0024816B78|nr:hypothetical protein [Desulfoscipio gibsoniae]